MNTKRIAREIGSTVAQVNAAARDLGIATYDRNCRCWRVADDQAAVFVAHLTEEF